MAAVLWFRLGLQTGALTLALGVADACAARLDAGLGALAQKLAGFLMQVALGKAAAAKAFSMVSRRLFIRSPVLAFFVAPALSSHVPGAPIFHNMLKYK